MRTLGLTALLWLFATAAASAADTREVWLTAGVSIDAQGHVTALEWTKSEPVYALIAERVTPTVRAWEFVPATAGGRPVATQTGLVIHLHLDARSDGSLRLRFDDARTGPLAISLQPPRYPRAAARAGVSARVTSLVRVDASGKPEVGELTVVSDGGDRGAFEAASREAIAHWSFRPEIVDGRAVASTIRIPITFCMEGSAACARFDRARQAPADVHRVDPPDGTYIATTSAVALKTDIRAQGI